MLIGHHFCPKSVHIREVSLYNIHIYLLESIHLGVEVRDVEHPVSGVQPEAVDALHLVPHGAAHHQSLERLEQVTHTVHLEREKEGERGGREGDIMKIHVGVCVCVRVCVKSVTCTSSPPCL